MAGTRAERLAKSRAVELSRLRIMLPRTAEPMVEECVALATELHERRVSRTKLMRMVLVRMHNELRALARSRHEAMSTKRRPSSGHECRAR